MNSGADSARPAPKKSVFGRLNDFVFGYDFFVSYCWADGREYAVALVRQLQDQGFECFLDSSDYAKGDNWRDQGRRALKKTSRLILVGTPKAMVSEPVQNELAIFSHLGRRILPIDFDGSLSNAPADSAVSRYLTSDTLLIKESSKTVPIGPSPETIEAIRGTFNLMRQQQKRTRLFAFATVVFAVISVVAIGLYSVASRRQAESMAMAWGAQGQTIFGENPMAGLYLARKGWKTVPDGSRSLNQRLTSRVLGLAEQGRLARIGTDILDAGLTDDGKLFIARKNTKGEIRYAADLRLATTLPQRVRQVSADPTGDYLVLANQESANDLNFAFHRRNNGKLVGYRKHLTQPPPWVFPSGSARYFFSETGSSPTITRLSGDTKVADNGFDIMQFHYETSWPVFALSFRDYGNTTRPPNAGLFDVHSGVEIHKFSSREIAYDQNIFEDDRLGLGRVRGYKVIRFIRPEDKVTQATVYAGKSAYVVASEAGLTLWYLGQALTLSELPAKIVAGEIGGQPYVLLLHEARSEIWSLANQRRLGEFPKLASTDFIPTLGGWLVTPASAGDDSLLLTLVSGELVSRPMGARISWKDRRADAQNRYFIASTGDKALQLRRTHDASLVPLSAPVAWFSFPRDESTPLFAVHYKGAQPSEIRRIADGGLVHTMPRKTEVRVEFEVGEFFIVNYFESDDRESLFLSELRRNADATLVAKERDEIEGYVTGPGGEVLLLETDGDLRVLLRSASGYQRLDKAIHDVSGRIIFHPDPTKRAFVTRDAETGFLHFYATVPDTKDPTALTPTKIGSSGSAAKRLKLLSAAWTGYLLVESGDDRLEVWSLDGNPRRVFVSQIGLAGFLQLPGEGRLFLWYDDGSAYVIDVRLADLASAAAESDDPMVTQSFLSYIEGELFKSHWLDQTVIDDQLESMRLD